MTINMATEAFEWNVLIVQLLNVTPTAQVKLKGFRKPFLEIDLYTDARTGVLIPFRLRAIQEMVELVSYISKGAFPLEMKGKMGDPNPNWGSRDLCFRIEVQGPRS